MDIAVLVVSVYKKGKAKILVRTVPEEKQLPYLPIIDLYIGEAVCDSRL